jgi:cell division protein FtsL
VCRKGVRSEMGGTVNLSADRTLWMDGGSRPRSISRKSNLLLLAVLFIFLMGGCLAYVWSRIQVIQAGYEISSAIKARREAVEENKRLRVEVASLKSYARIERIATVELGMSKPRPDQVIIIR